MKVLLLSDTFSEHTEKWATGLAGAGVEVGLFSFNRAAYEWYHQPNITVFYEPEHSIRAESLLTKISYLKYVTVLKKIIRHFKPDILHAHYASSYGLIGALSGFHPYVLSIWGSDVYDFPLKSSLHRRIFRHNLRKADALMSTSHTMKKEIQKYTNKTVKVIPFGVDVDLFSRKAPQEWDGFVNVGTIKPIGEKYGISYILEAASILVGEDSNHKYRFHFIGHSNNAGHYEKMVQEKNLAEHVNFTGRIPFNQIHTYHNKLDIFLNVSIDNSESFGVAAVEAMACERPVIVSDVLGLMEVVNEGEFGVVVPKRHPGALASAIRRFADDPAKAAELGKLARQHVLRNYDWKRNLELMMSVYKDLTLETLKVEKS